MNIKDQQGDNYTLFSIDNVSSKTIEEFLNSVRDDVLHVLEVNKKVIYTLKVILQKPETDEHGKVYFKTHDHYFVAHAYTLLTSDDMDTSYSKLTNFFNGELEDRETRESGWTLKSIENLDIKLCKYTPITGGCLSKLPPDIKKLRSIVDIKTNDNKCLMWAINLLEKNPSDHRDRPVTSLLNWDKISFPSSRHDLEIFERNKNCLVYCFGKTSSYYIYYRHKSFHTLKQHRRVFYLLHYQSHFFPIMNITMFLRTILDIKRSPFVCLSYLSNFSNQTSLDTHEKYCQHEYPTKINYPKENRTLKFRKYEATNTHPFLCVLDTESNLIPIHEQNGRF